MKSFLAALGLYFGSLLVLRYDLSDLVANGRENLWAGYLTLVMSGVLLAGLLRRVPNPVPRAWRLPAAAMAVLAALALNQYSTPLARSLGLTGPVAAVATTQGQAVLRAGFDGHYRAEARLNGAGIGFLIDTGASLVLLRYEDALAAGLAPDGMDFSLPVTTAGAEARVAEVVLDRLTVGGVTLTNVRAAVASPGLLHTSLLGMSWLDRLSETTIRDGRMIMRQ